MVYGPGLDDLVGGGLCDLRGDSESGPGKGAVAFDVLLLEGGIDKTKCAGLVWLELNDEPAICKGNGSVRGYKIRGVYIVRADRVAGGTAPDGSHRLHSGT